MLTKFGRTPLIANLGHGIHHQHQPDAIKSFVDAVHDISQQLFHAST
jgi:uroporphyrinogen-III decarboxylase